jgi:hypothetical protein
MSRTLCIYVDVDDTFVRSVGSKRIPIPCIVRHVAELHGQGAILYCWSSGGADYARQSAEEFGIAHYFTTFLPKPHIIIDDQPMAEWPQFLHVHPATTRSLHHYQATLHGEPPSPAMSITAQPLWNVMRVDDNGNHFAIAQGLAHEAAQAMVKQFEDSGHKQCYCISPNPDAPISQSL